MPTQDGSKPGPEGPGSRLWNARWTLATAFCALAAIGLVEPGLLPLLMLALLAIMAAAALTPPAGSSPLPRESRQARVPAWPDASTRAMAEALAYPAYIIDSRGVLRYANAAAAPAFGAPVIGEPASVTFRRPEVAEIITRGVATRLAQSGEIAEPVPRERWFNLQISPVPRPGGPPDFFLLTLMDMTQARRAEQMRSDFIANASHELRTPLASLRGFLETIKGPAANDRAATARFLDIMLDQSQRMSRLIDDLLSLSRIEMKAHLRPQGRVDLVSVLASVTASMQPLAEKSGVAIEQRLPAGPVEIVGERDELTQVFDNLVENACKYGRSGKKVEIEAVLLPDPDRPREVQVAVIDHGPGI
ncbi:MAG: PAS domain-containing protein, partial [Nitratireductor sp.]|nr:PAS domain-containing protein [Nitratireductor sp.]